MNYTLRQLRTFVAVAQHGSFSQAGQAIGLSQSAVSHSIKELEAEMGVRLLDRTTREVLLSEAGQQLATRLERLLEELNTTLLDVRSYGEQRSGTVRVAASQTPSAHLMPQCLASSQLRYPDIRVILHDRVQQWVLQSVRNAEVDFGIVIGPLQDADFDSEEILQEPFLLLCHQDDALAQVPQAQWSMLAGRAMVLQDYASGSRLLVDAALQRLALNVQVVQEIGHPATLYPMVEAGIGISILPALALPLPSGRKLTVRRLYPEINRSLMLIKRKNRSLTPAAEAIWQEVRQQAALLTQDRALNPAF
ncbi:LysR family transcripitonal regulator [Pantoea dispersa EGD-AAK13]|jgi:DNA-binding transcriptional LysR family regulator|uniref:LysR family transcriptional regulator n=1 Tax=Pantoea dispersa TaxID=59814 RepID=A0A8E1S0S9_9GAMM|nr:MULTISPECIES: LysR family transcriptional regulator [Pantoea]ERH63734.1 LysR family transcripitonal regulator [Pantoea dispersa EGD-AAK13]KAA6101724.1 LysR family transcriptional regulator [Pantoea sp. B_9]KAA6115599.1 LysR family transcriptional regulator [Pantoea sp. B_10]KAF0853165.1 LysR family transcriptional regulator [Pantoea dispersa 625]KTR91194.1 LysR family transcriptional regulator [Pantoea dispersa]